MNQILKSPNPDLDYMPVELSTEERRLVITIVERIVRDIEQRVGNLFPSEPVLIQKHMNEYNFRHSRISIGDFVHFAQGNGAQNLMELSDLLQNVHTMCAGAYQLGRVTEVIEQIHNAVSIIPLDDRTVTITDLGLEPVALADMVK